MLSSVYMKLTSPMLFRGVVKSDMCIERCLRDSSLRKSYYVYCRFEVYGF